jgi:hypothetical protein
MRQYGGQSQAGWIRLRRLIWARISVVLAGRQRGDYRHLRSTLPLQIAWVRDTLGDYLMRRIQPAFAKLNLDLTLSFRWRVPRLHVGVCVGIVGLAVFLIVSGTVHHRFTAEAQIAANAAPIPAVAALPVPVVAETELSMTEERTNDETTTRQELTQDEEIKLSNPASVTQVTSVKSPAAVVPTGTVSPAAVPVSRYDFDLEHGTPMLPETRGSKPAY